MLPRFFRAFAFICQLPKTAAVPSRSLQYYDADSELDVNAIKEWYDMVKTPLDEKTSMDQLRKEAETTTDKPCCMKHYLQIAEKSKNCGRVPSLTRAECLVVIMYIRPIEGSETPFYSEYNADSSNKKWQPYKVYTTLLMSALQKLAEIDPIPPNATLFRGINIKPERPSAKRIFWKAFTSASLCPQVAKKFSGSNGTILGFKPPHSPYAARVRILSTVDENEVLLPPFIAFEFLKTEDSNFIFTTSEVQKLLNP